MAESERGGRPAPCNEAQRPGTAAPGPGFSEPASIPAQGHPNAQTTQAASPQNGPAPPLRPPAPPGLFTFSCFPSVPCGANNLTSYICNQEWNQIRQSSPRARGQAEGRERSSRWRETAGRVGGGGRPRPGLQGPRGRSGGGAGEAEGAPGAGGGCSHFARQAHLAGRAGRVGARPRDPAQPGTLGSAGGGRTARTRRQRGEQPFSAGAAGEPGAWPGLAGGGAGPGQGLRAARRGQWLGLDDRCGGAGPAEGRPARKPQTGGPRGVQGPGVSGWWGPRLALRARLSRSAQRNGR